MTDTEPLHEWCCPACGATTRARMADREPTEPEPLAMQARTLLVRERRVRAYADEIEVAGVVMGSMVAREIRAALDGEPQP